MKKVLAILLAVLSIVGCFSVAAYAEEEGPETTASGYYEGQILTPGDSITSVYDTCESLIFTYVVGDEDAPFVSSALQKKYAADTFVGLVTFRDNIASFTSGEVYGGVYTVKGAGEAVGEMEVANGSFKSAQEIMSGLSSDELDKMKNPLEVTIDYDYAKTTYYQYTTIVAWEVVSVRDLENSLVITVEAVYDTAEPTGWQSFVEANYSNWLKFLDVIGNMLLKIVPAVLAFWARLLGNK